MQCGLVRLRRKSQERVHDWSNLPVQISEALIQSTINQGLFVQFEVGSQTVRHRTGAKAKEQLGASVSSAAGRSGNLSTNLLANVTVSVILGRGSWKRTGEVTQDGAALVEAKVSVLDRRDSVIRVHGQKLLSQVSATHEVYLVVLKPAQR